MLRYIPIVKNRGELIKAFVHIIEGQMGLFLVLILIRVGITCETAIGISALILGDQNIRELSSQINLDLGKLENSISRRETHVDFLIEVILWNMKDFAWP